MNDLENTWDVDTGEEGGDEQAEEDEEPGGLEVAGEFQEQLEKEKDVCPAEVEGVEDEPVFFCSPAESDEEGEAEVLRQIACIRDAASWGCGLVVMHAVVGMERISPQESERERAFRLFGRIFEAAREAGVLVALENTEGEQYLDALLTHFRGHSAVRFCIDTGHEMCYDHGHDLIGKYSDLLYCTHLNDNLGMSGSTITWLDDLHLLPFDGAADWEGIVSRLQAAHYRGDLTFEVKLEGREGRHEHDAYRALSFFGYASLARERAERLRKMFFAKQP